MKLLFTGDVNLRGQDNLSREHFGETLSQVQPFIKAADFVIPNLECPLGKADCYAPIAKSGPNLICPEESMNFLTAMNASAVTLANNHMGDYGSGALKNTLRLLDESGLLHAGAGLSVEEAYQPFFLEKDGLKAAVFSVCEHEFGLSDEQTPGSAAYEPRRLLASLRAARAQAEWIVVVFHGGNEFNPLPSPDTLERYRLICDMGADAVIGGHTHCPQGYEIYQGKPIVYSLGNFFFKSSSGLDERDSWHYGLMAMLDINAQGISLDVIPCKFNREATRITVFEGEARAAMRRYVDHLSAIIQNTALLKSYFKGWAWNHPWCPALPTDSQADYHAAGNYDLVCCEAHLSQLKQRLETHFLGEEEEAKRMEEAILALQKMPV